MAVFALLGGHEPVPVVLQAVAPVARPHRVSVDAGRPVREGRVTCGALVVTLEVILMLEEDAARLELIDVRMAEAALSDRDGCVRVNENRRFLRLDRDGAQVHCRHRGNVEPLLLVAHVAIRYRVVTEEASVHAGFARVRVGFGLPVLHMRLWTQREVLRMTVDALAARDDAGRTVREAVTREARGDRRHGCVGIVVRVGEVARGAVGHEVRRVIEDDVGVARGPDNRVARRAVARRDRRGDVNRRGVDLGPRR